MNRPTGVTILAILNFIGAAFCVLGGLGLMLGGGALAGIMSQQGQAGGGLFAALGAAAGIAVLIGGALAALIGFGLWKLKNWARILSIVFTALGALMNLLGLLGSLAHFNVGTVVWSVFCLAIDVWIIMYLLKPEIKAAFDGAQVRATSA